MLFSMKSALVMAGIASLVLSSPVALVERTDSEPSCINITIPVIISAENYVLPPTSPLTYQLIQGAFNISGRYCKPQVKDFSRTDTLQFLVHGFTYTKNYWSGDGAPGHGFHGPSYSWIAYAGSEGYPTLSIDRICNGLSDHPDPTAVCQTAVNVEIIHQIIVKARSGQLPVSGIKSFRKVILVGHSYGSVINNFLQAKYPADVDAGILTAWAEYINTTYLNPIFTPALAPAYVVSPTEYASLSAPYLEFNNSTIFQFMFYHPGNYDPELFNLDYYLRGSVAAGEFASLEIGYSTPAPSYTGPVLVMTGQYDRIFCPTSTGNCGSGWSTFLESSKTFYPAASSFDGYAQPGAGHCWNFHYHAQDGFDFAHDWLAQKGF